MFFHKAQLCSVYEALDGWILPDHMLVMLQCKAVNVQLVNVHRLGSIISARSGMVRLLWTLITIVLPSISMTNF